MNSDSDSNKKTGWKAVKRGAAYSLAAGVATGAMATEADAVIQYSGIYNINLYQGNSLNLDLDAGGATGDVMLKNYVNFGGNYQGLTVNYFPGQVVGFNNGLAYVSALSEGDPIDASTVGPSFFGSMAYGATNPNAEFNSVTDAYIGLSFPINSVTHFGWIRVDIDNAAGTFLIKDWAYEDAAGVGIPAGAIPEPGTLGLLAAGACGLAAMRRRNDRG
ncbi:MAG: PEP-CTERM sorting domain-containing protein [Planctomycetota bacterium]